MKPIFMRVRPTGGATSPLRRRRLSRSHSEPPSSTTITTMPIQLTVGSTLPYMRFEIMCTLLESPESGG